MAEHLGSIFGTEKDRVNCPFYFKIGSCRHGDRCSRLHTKPSISPTLPLSNMYRRPDMITPGVDPQGQPSTPRKSTTTSRFPSAIYSHHPSPTNIYRTRLLTGMTFQQPNQPKNRPYPPQYPL